MSNERKSFHFFVSLCCCCLSLSLKSILIANAIKDKQKKQRQNKARKWLAPPKVSNRSIHPKSKLIESKESYNFCLLYSTQRRPLFSTSLSFCPHNVYNRFSIHNREYRLTINFGWFVILSNRISSRNRNSHK